MFLFVFVFVVVLLFICCLSCFVLLFLLLLILLFVVGLLCPLAFVGFVVLVFVACVVAGLRSVCLCCSCLFGVCILVRVLGQQAETKQAVLLCLLPLPCFCVVNCFCQFFLSIVFVMFACLFVFCILVWSFGRRAKTNVAFCGVLLC